MADGIQAADYDLASLLELHKKAVMTQVNCVAIGIVQSFDDSNQTVEATIAYKRVINGALAPYPVLIDCPAFVIGGKTKRVEVPIEPGDECIVLFNDRDIDNWFSSGQIQELATTRMHAFSDALVLVGIRSLKNSISDFDNTRVSLRNGSVMVAAGASKVRIQNGSKNLLGVVNALQDIVNQLNTALTTFSTSVAAATTVVEVAAAGTALQSALTPITALLTAYPTAESGALLE